MKRRKKYKRSKNRKRIFRRRSRNPRYKIVSRGRSIYFDSLGSARKAANDYFRRTKIVLGIEEVKSRAKKRNPRRSRNPKLFYERMDVGRRGNYTVNYHDGVQTHRDGSPFYGIAIFRNKRKKDQFIRSLLKQGYREKNWNE